MTNMAAMPIFGKNLKKSSSPEPVDQWPWNFVCSIVYASTVASRYLDTVYLDPITYVEPMPESHIFPLYIYCILTLHVSNLF